MNISSELDEGTDGIISFTLMRGCDDWVQACEIVGNIFCVPPLFKADISPEILEAISEAEKRGGPEEFAVARDLSISIIRTVLTKGYMMIGSTFKGFEPWKCTIEEAIQMVRVEWDAMKGKLPGLGVYWLCNTKLGDEIGQKALVLWRQARDNTPKTS